MTSANTVPSGIPYQKFDAWIMLLKSVRPKRIRSQAKLAAELIKAGYSGTEASRAMDVSPSLVYNACRHLGVRLTAKRGARRNELVAQMVAEQKTAGRTLSQIATSLGISRARVDQILNPEKRLARSAVRYAIKTGRLARPPFCSRCGSDNRIHAHHPNYEQRLEVLWLCSKCHSAAHRSGICAKDPSVLPDA